VTSGPNAVQRRPSQQDPRREPRRPDQHPLIPRRLSCGHPKIFGNLGTAASYGFVRSADRSRHVRPGCRR
jgi:hypothetical protein